MQSLFSRGSALSAALIGAAALVGWAVNVPAFVRFPAHGPSTLPNTAVGLILAGIALLVIRPGRTGKQRRSTTREVTAKILGAGVLLLGGLTLAEYLFQLNLQVDDLLFRSKLPGGFASGRPSPQSAVNLTLVGLAVLTLDVGTVRGKRPAEYLALAVAGISLLALGGHAYQAPELYRFEPHKGISLYAAIGFLILSIAILTSPRARGFATISTSRGTPRRLLRVLAPLIVVLPLLPLAFTAWIVPRYDEPIEVGLAAFSTLLIGILIWYFASSVNRIEAERRNARLKLVAMLESIPAGIVAVDADGTIVQVNSETERLFGHRRENLLGRSVLILVTERARQAAIATKLFSNGWNHLAGPRVRLVGLRADGTEFPINIGFHQTATDEGPLFIAAVRATDRPVRVLVVEDDRSSSEALAAVIGLEPDMECVGVVPTVNEALELVTPQPPGVIVLRMHPPASVQIEETRRMRERFPEARVLLLTEQANLEGLARAASAGASGFLSKESSLEEILAAVRSANDHGMVVARSALLRILSQAHRVGPPLPAPRPTLTLTRRGRPRSPW
ncbi:MAG TPA: response regulator [Actinomycetota bacterium]|nr:response regulator [Actinomycetota bacterium]